MRTLVGTHVVRARYGYDMARMGEALQGRWDGRREKSGLSEGRWTRRGRQDGIDFASDLGGDVVPGGIGE